LTDPRRSVLSRRNETAESRWHHQTSDGTGLIPQPVGRGSCASMRGCLCSFLRRLTIGAVEATIFWTMDLRRRTRRNPTVESIGPLDGAA
jgi:hypothetical protein